MRSERPIAVVDDDPAACTALIDLVRALGFSAIGFGSAISFLHSADVFRVCCVIADMRMAVMSGLELSRQLAMAGNPVPTILITAYPDETTRLEAATLGLRAYLTKPCSPDELLQALHLALGV